MACEERLRKAGPDACERQKWRRHWQSHVVGLRRVPKSPHLTRQSLWPNLTRDTTAAILLPSVARDRSGHGGELTGYMLGLLLTVALILTKLRTKEHSTTLAS